MAHDLDTWAKAIAFRPSVLSFGLWLESCFGLIFRRRSYSGHALPSPKPNPL